MRWSTPGHLSQSTRIAGLVESFSHCTGQVSLRFRFALLIISQIYRFAGVFLFVDSGFLGFPQRKTLHKVFDFDFDLDIDMSFIADRLVSIAARNTL